ncbi:MAG: serine/threonine protein kinase [Frankiales bacterium]|nr:serine/threonine protein kinase [Frankiales bacterium]
MTERVDEIRMTAGELVAGRYRLTAPARDTPGHALWRAEDEVLGREVAVRLVCGPGALLAAMHGAATRAGGLVHDGVAAIYDTGTAANCVYIVREWVPGDSLQSLLAAGPLDAHMVSEVGVQLADILTAVTAAGLHHERLHLGNVIVTPNGGVKITDLETAGALDDRHAPEARWFGGVLYGALTGRWPYPQLPAPAGMPEAPTGDDGRLCSPSQLRAGVPNVLDTVTMRALTSPEFAREGGTTGIADLAGPLRHLPRSQPGPAGVDELLPAYRDSRVSASQQRAWLAIGLSVVTTVVLLLWAAARIAGPTGPIPFFQDHQPAAAGTPGGTTSASSGASTAARPLSIAAVADYDPFGNDGQEDPSRVALVTNGNPEDGWHTAGYDAPLSLIGKKGVGVVVDLGRAASPREFDVTFDRPGTSWELRTADSAKPDFGATTRVSAGSTVSAASTATVGNGVSSRFWVVWLTALTQSPVDGKYRAEIREISVR